MNKINLIIPLNGIGSRFKEYTEPKPLIKIFDKEMIFWLLDNLDLSLVNKIFIPYNRKLRDYNFEQRVADRYTLEKIHLLCVPYDTLGAAETLNYTVQNLKEEDLYCNYMCMDCDTFYFENVIQQYKKAENKNIIYYFEDNTERDIFSFIKIQDEIVIEIAEKDKISNFANCGIFCFESGYLMKDYINLLLKNNHLQKNEFYISGIFDLMIKSKIQVNSIKINNFSCVGTPQQLEEFMGVEINV